MNTKLIMAIIALLPEILDKLPDDLIDRLGSVGGSADEELTLRLDEIQRWMDHLNRQIEEVKRTLSDISYATTGRK